MIDVPDDAVERAAHHWYERRVRRAPLTGLERWHELPELVRERYLADVRAVLEVALGGTQ